MAGFLAVFFQENRQNECFVPKMNNKFFGVHADYQAKKFA
jgi:hypothetical protein